MHFLTQFFSGHSGHAAFGRLIDACPKSLGRLLGYVLGLGFGACMGITVLSLKIHRIEDSHARVIGMIGAVEADADALLKELGAAYTPDCDAANLNRIRSMLFGHSYIRNVGLLDAQGRLFCTTSVGRLAAPVALGTGPIDGVLGRYIMNAPIHEFNGNTIGAGTVSILERGRFQAVLDDALTRDVLQRNADALWAGPPHQRRQVFKRRADFNAVPQLDTPHVGIDWNERYVVVTSMEPGPSPFWVQTALPLTPGKHALLLLAAIVGASTLIGMLAAHSLSVRLRYLQSMDFRILRLCRTAHVVCHYQPILELASRRVVGCEVLARLWDGRQLIQPDQFIAALDRQSLHWTFDAAVSSCALRELGGALAPQADFTVALNFFSQSLKRDVLHRHLQAARGGRSDLRIELEVTEYAFSPEVVPELDRLKSDGYAISIDDFGTGYSNLGMVRRVAPDYLKIDRSFVFEMEDATLRSSLLPEIVAIANAVGSKVIAEGIENAAQAERLQALGVQYGQGFHFAQPMPLAQFQQFLRAQRGA